MMLRFLVNETKNVRAGSFTSLLDVFIQQVHIMEYFLEGSIPLRHWYYIDPNKKTNRYKSSALS